MATTATKRDSGTSNKSNGIAPIDIDFAGLSNNSAEKKELIPTPKAEADPRSPRSTKEADDQQKESGFSRLAKSISARSHKKRAKSLFANPDDMKKDLEEKLTVKHYDVCDFYSTEGKFQEIARHQKFENITLGVISFNALWISIDTDWNTAATLNDAEPIFILAENFFCIYFLFEWIMRFGAFQNKLNCFRDAWFMFDSFMVTMMVIETWILFTLLAVTGSGGNMGNSGSLRLLRLLRLSRMARMARLLRSMPELLILIKGIGAALRSVVFTLLLMFLIMYVFAIFFRQLTNGSDYGKVYFKTTLSTMHSLWAYGVLCDSFGVMAFGIAEQWLEDDMTTAVMLGIGWYAFVLLSSLMLLNMLIGILCEVVCAVASTEREGIEVDFMQESFQRLVKKYIIEAEGGQKVDVHDAVISKETFLRLIQKSDVLDLFNDVGIDCFDLVDLVDMIFTSDTGEEIEHLTGELIQELLHHRSANSVSVKDITDTRKFVNNAMVKWDKTLGAYTSHEKQFKRETEVQLGILGDLIEKVAGESPGTFRKQAQALADEKLLELKLKNQKKKNAQEVASGFQLQESFANLTKSSEALEAAEAARSSDASPEIVTNEARGGNENNLLEGVSLEEHVASYQPAELEAPQSPSDGSPRRSNGEADGGADGSVSVGSTASESPIKRKKKKKIASKLVRSCSGSARTSSAGSEDARAEGTEQGMEAVDESEELADSSLGGEGTPPTQL